MKVLIYDPEDQLQRFLAQTLEEWGFETIVVPSDNIGSIVVTTLQENRGQISAVLLVERDLRTELEDGIGLIHYLSSWDEFKHIRIIAYMPNLGSLPANKLKNALGEAGPFTPQSLARLLASNRLN